MSQALAAHIAFLGTPLAAIVRHIRDDVNSHPDLREPHDLLTSIPGIITTIAFRILAAAGDLRRFAAAWD